MVAGRTGPSVGFMVLKLLELPHDKTIEVICAPSKYSDQPGQAIFMRTMKTDQTGRIPRLN